MQDNLPNVELAKVIRDCQMRVSEAYAKRGDSHALAALACSSIVLQAYVEAGSLRQDVIHHLAETADNLGMTKRLGEGFVEIALECGLRFYNDLSHEWEWQRSGEAAA